VFQLRLPARSATQARAAARLMLRDRLAGDPAGLHLAIGAPGEDWQRLVVAVEPAMLRDWLARAAATGFEADRVVPAPLLLETPAPDIARVAEFDGQWLVHGDGLCFAGEPELATQVLEGRTTEHLPDAEAALASGAPRPAIDLLQDAFAIRAEPRRGWPAWRRAAILAGLLPLSPLLLAAAGALRDHFAARQAEALAADLVRSVVPAMPPDADPLAVLRSHWNHLQGPDRFTTSHGRLFEAVAGIDGAELDRLEWRGGALHAAVVLPDAAGLEQLRSALSAAGLELVEEDASPGGAGRVRHQIVLGTLP
jgi:general secretion pathway protein L